jgi:tetratricopeptide (TPR) repeat protein
MQLTQLQFQQAFAQAQQLHRSGRYGEAHSLYSKLNEMAPNQAPILAMLGSVERQMGRLDDARTHLAQAIKIQPRQAMFHHELSLVHKLSNDFRKAHRSLDTALSLQPQEIAFIAAKAELHHMAGEYEQSMKALEPAVDQEPIRPSVALMFAKLASHHGQTQKCVDLLKSCLDRKEIPSTMRVQLFFHLGDLLHAQGETDEAFAAYQQGNWAKDAHFDSARHSKAVDDAINAWTRPVGEARGQGGNFNQPSVLVGGGIPTYAKFCILQNGLSHGAAPKGGGSWEFILSQNNAGDAFRVDNSTGPVQLTNAELLGTGAGGIALNLLNGAQVNANAACVINGVTSDIKVGANAGSAGGGAGFAALVAETDLAAGNTSQLCRLTKS